MIVISALRDLIIFRSAFINGAMLYLKELFRTYLFCDVVESHSHGRETLGAVAEPLPKLQVFTLKFLMLRGRRTNFDQIRLVVVLRSSRTRWCCTVGAWRDAVVAAVDSAVGWGWSWSSHFGIGWNGWKKKWLSFEIRGQSYKTFRRLFRPLAQSN